ncbi:MAG: DUF6662 family protein [Pseudomonadota bacterium]
MISKTDTLKLKNYYISGFTAMLCLASTPAYADESLFAYAIGSDTQQKGRGEASIRLTDRFDKDSGRYNGLDVLFGTEYGVSNRLSVGVDLEIFKLNYKNAFAQIQTSPGVFQDFYEPQFNKTKVGRYGFNVKYQISSPYTSKIGVAINTEIYYRPNFGRVDGSKQKQLSFEPSLILQKNFRNDTIVTLLNIKAEIETVKNRQYKIATIDANEIKFEPTAGVSYRFARNLYIGAEGFYRADNANGKFNHDSLFLGPTIHYGGKNFYLTATFLRQLTGSPTYSFSTRDFFVGRGVNLEEETRNEARLKIGFNL